MILKKLLPIAALLLFAASCNKSDSLSDNPLVDESTTIQQSPNETHDDQVTSRDNSATYSQNPNIEPFREMFGNHFNYQATVEPWYYLPEPIRGTFQSKYLEEKALFDAVGHDAWVDQKVLDGTYSIDFGVSMKNLNTTVDGITSGNISGLVQTLESQRNSLSLISQEQATAQLIYDIILTVINELYPEGGLEFRADPCKLSDLIDDIKTGAEIGATVGEIVSAIFENDGNEETVGEVIINVAGQAVAVSLTIVGAVIGGIIGGVVGIFNGNDCDCGPPLGISVVNPTAACSSTSGFQLFAWGAGDDAEFYD